MRGGDREGAPPGVVAGIAELRLPGVLPHVHGVLDVLPAQGRADGATLRERHQVPREAATVATGNVIRSLRRYFLGVTYVAAFNAIVAG